MLYVELNGDYQVIVKGSINGQKVSPFVYGELTYDKGCGYVFIPSDSGYPWECGTKDEEAALATIENDANINVRNKDI